MPRYRATGEVVTRRAFSIEVDIPEEQEPNAENDAAAVAEALGLQHYLAEGELSEDLELEDLEELE